MAEFITVTWAAVQCRLREHDESVLKIMNHWRKNAWRFKLRSLRYFSQAIGGNPFTYGHVMIYEFESLADWGFRKANGARQKGYGVEKSALY